MTYLDRQVGNEGPSRAPSRPVTTQRTPAGSPPLLDLQRLAGNAAVNQAIRSGQFDPGLPVQRLDESAADDLDAEDEEEAAAEEKKEEEEEEEPAVEDEQAAEADQDLGTDEETEEEDRRRGDGRLEGRPSAHAPASLARPASAARSAMMRPSSKSFGV